MHTKKKKDLVFYAKVLIFFSLVLIGTGIFIDFHSDTRLINPIDDVSPVREEENTISITTVDGSEVVPGNKITNIKDKTDKNQNTASEKLPDTSSQTSNENSNINIPNTNVGVGGGNTNTTNNNTGGQTGGNSVHVPSIDEANESLKRSIETTYGITIKYGRETYGYTVGGISTVPVENSTTINAALNRLKSAFSLYPSGFFTEIRNGGIPLSVILINSYSDESITGVTDSSYTYANISIALMHPFEDSFYHESYHYIERYLFKRGANYNSWNTLNPADFRYGTIINNYSYANTFSDSVPFVNNYAQTSDAEDRASTFEYMMAGSKASCLNYGRPVWYKASLIKNTIEAVFNTVSPNVVEYWERYV